MVTLKEGKLPHGRAEALSELKISKDNNATYNLVDRNESIHRDESMVNEIEYHGYFLSWVICVEQVEKLSRYKVKTGKEVHITDLPGTIDNVTKISQTARLRCNIENQGFNAQKNHGYNLKHKYSYTNQN
jgi:hypothetical protein